MLDELDRLNLLASAVAGRSVTVSPAAGERAWTDGRTIFVPPSDPDLLEATVLVQAALIASGGLDIGILKRLTGHRRLHPHYLALEVARAAVTVPVLPPRVAARVAEVVPGPCAGSAAESLAWAQERRRPIVAPPAWFGELRPGQVRRAAAADSGSAPVSPADDLRLDEGVPELDPDEAESSRVLEMLSMPGSSPLSSIFRKMLGMGRSPGEGGGGGGDNSTGEDRGPGRPGEHARRLATTLPPRVVDSRPVPRGAHYPEWDVRRQVLRPDRCVVAEFDPPASELDGSPLVVEDRALRRQLAALGHAAEYRTGHETGDVLDLNALVDLVADRAAGDTREARIYAQPRRTGRDLGVLVLLDATSSSADSVDGRRQYDEHRRIVDGLTGALDRLGNPVAAFGFLSAGRQDVRFLRVKSFADRYDAGARRRLACIEPHGFTRLGAAVRHATAVLEREAGTTRRLLVMVGDGFPYESDYEGDYAEADCRHALDAAIARGIGCVRISVDAGHDPDPAVDRIWQDLPQARLVDAGALPAQIRPLFARAVRTAAASRRSIRSAEAPAPTRRRLGGVRA
ncbi:hypothetical protein GCM10009547_00070 [Sporichthya brevicatena]|uniref:VWFA domain-containing protein n=1 Tax=Sporichthya brevicatena TaxID=171442 RepID=A0ABN1G271_9ACTN